MKNYLAWYLIAGTCVFWVIMATSAKKARSLTIEDSSDPFWLRLTSNALKLVITVVVWPALMYLLLEEIIGDIMDEEELVFTVSLSELFERLTIAEIEQREQVKDPLQAAPALPFGFLNPKWRDFTALLQAGDEMWTFRAIRKKGIAIRTEGYVIVRSGVAGPHFITARKWPDD